MYYSDDHDDLCSSHETKENVDVNNFNIIKTNISASSSRDSEMCDKNIFNSCTDDSFIHDVNNLNSRTKSRLSNGSIKFKPEGGDMDTVTNSNWRRKVIKESPVWCMDFCNDLIILGCADGRLEFWEASTGKLMVSIVHETISCSMSIKPTTTKHG